MRRFDATPRRTAPKGHNPSIIHAAPPQRATNQPPLRVRQHTISVTYAETEPTPAADVAGCPFSRDAWRRNPLIHDAKPPAPTGTRTPRAGPDPSLPVSSSRGSHAYARSPG